MTNFTLALPSKGELAEPTDSFLREAGLKIVRPNPRQYTGSIASMRGVNVLYQRVKDVVYKVADGTAQLGIAGLDIVREYASGDVVVIHANLNYGHCNLTVAVPEAWVDVHSINDIVEIAQDLRTSERRNLRIATTFPALTRQFFHQHHIHHFLIVKAEGAIEAAPTIGYADIIVDLTQSGTTLRENHLKPLADGVILESQACLIGNKSALQEQPALRSVVRELVDYMDATLSGREYCQLTVDIRGSDSTTIARLVSANEATSGLLGPTIAPIYTLTDETWYTVQLTVKGKNLLPAVDYLRSIGGAHVVISPVKFLFRDSSRTYQNLLAQLGLENVSNSL